MEIKVFSYEGILNRETRGVKFDLDISRFCSIKRIGGDLIVEAVKEYGHIKVITKRAILVGGCNYQLESPFTMNGVKFYDSDGMNEVFESGIKANKNTLITSDQGNYLEINFRSKLIIKPKTRAFIQIPSDFIDELKLSCATYFLIE